MDTETILKLLDDEAVKAKVRAIVAEKEDALQHLSDPKESTLTNNSELEALEPRYKIKMMRLKI